MINDANLKSGIKTIFNSYLMSTAARYFANYAFQYRFIVCIYTVFGKIGGLSRIITKKSDRFRPNSKSESDKNQNPKNRNPIGTTKTDTTGGHVCRNSALLSLDVLVQIQRHVYWSWHLLLSPTLVFQGSPTYVLFCWVMPLISGDCRIKPKMVRQR